MSWLEWAAHLHGAISQYGSREVVVGGTTVQPAQHRWQLGCMKGSTRERRVLGCVITSVWSCCYTINLTSSKSLLDVYVISDQLAANPPAGFPVSKALAQGNGGVLAKSGRTTLWCHAFLRRAPFHLT